MYPLYGVAMRLNNASVFMLHADQDEHQALYEMLVEQGVSALGILSPAPSLGEVKAGPRIKGCKACITHLSEESR